MDGVINVLGEELLEIIVKVLPFVIVAGALPPIIKFLFGCLDYGSSSVDIDIFTKPDIEEVKEPEKPKEVIIKLVKMQPVTKAKEVPKFCPYCAGIPDNDDRCSYCGIKF